MVQTDEASQNRIIRSFINAFFFFQPIGAPVTDDNAASAAPSTETVGGSMGASTAYMRADARLPRITRAGMVVTDSAGAWSISWSASLAASPATLPIPMIPAGGTQPIVCLPSISTATGAAGKCWYARTLPSALVAVTSLVSFDVFGAPASNITVQVFAIPVTQ